MSCRKDCYCWYCKADSCKVFCSRCQLGFHLHCAEENEEEIQYSGRSQQRSIRECRQCTKIKASRSLHTTAKKRKFEEMSKMKLNQILGEILIRGVGIQSPPEIMRNISKVGRLTNMLDIINFGTIEEKIADNQYACPEEMLYDLRRIKHVMTIEYKDEEGVKEIDQYIRDVELNCQDLDFCPHCAFNEYFGSHTKASLCPWPHRPILFDRSKGIGFTDDMILKGKLEKLPALFPGKLVGFNPSKYSAWVSFFSSQEPFSLEVPNYNIYHLRETDLDSCIAQKNSIETDKGKKHLEKAIEEVKKYIENLKQEFGNKWQFTDKKRIFRTHDQTFIAKLAKEPIGEVNSSPPQQEEQIPIEEKLICLKKENQDSSPDIFMISDDSSDTQIGKRSWEEMESDKVKIKAKKVAQANPSPPISGSNSVTQAINGQQQQEALVSLMKSDFDYHINSMINQLRTLQQDFDQRLVGAGTLWDAVRQASANMSTGHQNFRSTSGIVDSCRFVPHSAFLTMIKG